MIRGSKSKALLALTMMGFLFGAPASSIGADRTIDTEHSTLKIHVGKAGLFSVAGHDHWVTARFADGGFNDSDSAQVSFAVDARRLMLAQGQIESGAASGSPAHHAYTSLGE